MKFPRDGSGDRLDPSVRTAARTVLPDGRDFRLFVAASILMAVGACVYSSSFNNYLRDRFALGITGRTFLELPRELPGFLVSFSIGILAVLGEVRIAAVAALLASAGILALGWIPPSYVLMLGAVFTYSSGQHIFMPISNSIGMGFAMAGSEGAVLGRIQSAATIALVSGTGALLLLFRFAGLGYRTAYSIGAVAYLAAALCLLLMTPPRLPEAPRRFVVKRAYSRFYLLSVLYGARKQLYITFGPWMIVDLFGQSVSTMTLLFFLVSLCGIYLKPAVGRLTDRFGPRKVLAGEALVTVGLCLLYAFVPGIFPAGIALPIIAICYVADQALDSVAMARSIYAKQLVRDPRDLAPTLSFGISVDHLVAMMLPMLGGLVWRSAGAAGYRWVFLGGALVSGANYFVARPGRRRSAET